MIVSRDRQESIITLYVMWGDSESASENTSNRKYISTVRGPFWKMSKIDCRVHSRFKIQEIIKKFQFSHLQLIRECWAGVIVERSYIDFTIMPVVTKIFCHCQRIRYSTSRMNRCVVSRSSEDDETAAATATGSYLFAVRSFQICLND